MAFLHQLQMQFLHYWQFPGFRVVLGLLLMAIGIIYLQMPECKLGAGLIMTAVGLGIMMYGVSSQGFMTAAKPVPVKAAPPPKPKSYMKIEVAPRPANKP